MVDTVKVRMVVLRENPYLKRETRSKRAKTDKTAVLVDNPDPLRNLFPNDVAKHAPVFVIEIVLGPDEFFLHSLRSNRSGNELRMGMA
jgi:hypothetical protein